MIHRDTLVEVLIYVKEGISQVPDENFKINSSWYEDCLSALAESEFDIYCLPDIRVFINILKALEKI